MTWESDSWGPAERSKHMERTRKDETHAPVDGEVGLSDEHEGEVIPEGANGVSNVGVVVRAPLAGLALVFPLFFIRFGIWPTRWAGPWLLRLALRCYAVHSQRARVALRRAAQERKVGRSGSIHVFWRKGSPFHG